MQLGDTGLEPVTSSSSNDKPLCEQGKSGGAESGAFSADSPQIDPDLAKVIDAWPKLAEAIRIAVLAMVNASQADGGGT